MRIWNTIKTNVYATMLTVYIFDDSPNEQTPMKKKESISSERTCNINSIVVQVPNRVQLVNDTRYEFN